MEEAWHEEGAWQLEGMPPALSMSSGHVFPGGLEIGEQRSALADSLEVLDFQIDFSFARDRQQMQHGVGRAAGGGYGRNRVFKRGRG